MNLYHSYSGNCCIRPIVDHLSRFVQAERVPNAFVHEYCMLLGSIKILVTDYGSMFNLKSEEQQTTPYPFL